jgi:hypothetical protein
VAYPCKEGKETTKKTGIINACIFFIPDTSLLMVWNLDNALIINLERKEGFSPILIHLDAVFVSGRITRSAQFLATCHPCLLHMAKQMNIKYLIKSASRKIKTIGNMVGGQGEK